MSPMLPAKMSCFNALVLDTEIDSSLRLIASTKLAHFSDIKESGQKRLKDLDPVEASERYYYLSNLLSRITTLISDMKVYRGGKVKDPLKVPAVYDEAYLQSIEQNLKTIEDNFNDLTQKLAQAETAEDKKAKKEIKKQTEALADEERGYLLGWEELVKREHALEETKTLFGKTKRTYVMYGWIPTRKIKKFTEIVAETIALEIHEHLDEPENGEHPAEVGPLEGAVAEEERGAPPTKQENPKSIGTYQALVNAFGFPSHIEIDPTWFMAIGFPIIFGLMFGDIGHGILLLFFAMLGMIAKRRKVDAGEMVNYFIQGSGLIAVIAIFSIFFGVLYGEFLGIDISGFHYYVGTGADVVAVYPYQNLKYSPFGIFMKDILVTLFRFFDFDGGINWFLDFWSPYNTWANYLPHGHPTPIWFSAFEMPEHLPATVASPTWLLFVLSIMIGFIHLSIAIGFDAINKLRHRDFKHAIFGPIIWLFFLWGLAYMIFYYGINFMSWPLVEMMLFLILPAIIMFLGGMIFFGFMDGFMEGLEHLIESISNTISYSRILALNMAHAGFAKTFIFLAGLTGAVTIHNILDSLGNGSLSLIVFIGMLVLGTVFVLLMEGLLSFIHTLRLHWVEAFLKFYAGTGYEYKPLMLPQTWTTTSK